MNHDIDRTHIRAKRVFRQGESPAAQIPLARNPLLTAALADLVYHRAGEQIPSIIPAGCRPAMQYVPSAY